MARGHRLGMIVRADCGGLAAQTLEIARHLKPATVLVMDLGTHGRGTTELGRLNEALSRPHERRVATTVPMTDEDAAWLTSRCDVLFSCETGYHDDLHAICRARGVRFVLQANPELHKSETTADLIVNPTVYGNDRLGWPILPVPVPLDRLTYRRRTKAQTFLHVSAPAMLDRNGTELVFKALRSVRSRVDVRIVGRAHRVRSYYARVHWCPPVENWWDNYTPDIDVLLLPRRYAGLALPAQEAAGAGIPTVALDTPPLNQTCLTVPAQVERVANFAGGQWPVHRCQARDLAAMIDRLATEPELVAEASDRARAWAESISWPALLDQYRSTLSP